MYNVEYHTFMSSFKYFCAVFLLLFCCCLFCCCFVVALFLSFFFCGCFFLGGRGGDMCVFTKEFTTALPAPTIGY